MSCNTGLLRHSGAEEDDQRPDEANARSDYIPPVRQRAFDHPKPPHRTADINAAIGCERAACQGAVAQRQQVGEQHK
jgi:hypothetical protein